MIHTNSRYYNGSLHQETSGEVFVHRSFPKAMSFSDIAVYIWKDGDRPDIVASRIFGDANKWYILMDMNPEILNPWGISIGTVLRIPNG